MSSLDLFRHTFLNVHPTSVVFWCLITRRVIFAVYLLLKEFDEFAFILTIRLFLANFPYGYFPRFLFNNTRRRHNFWYN